MAVIHDVMPAFELFQPASVERRAEPARSATGPRPGCMAGGLDTFDWLKDRTKRTERRRRPEPGGGAARDQGGRTAASRSARLTTLTEVARHPVVREQFGLLRRGGRAGGLAADPQPGDARRQRLAGHALLVLPQRLDVLPGRRQHLLRRHADGDQPRARDPQRRPLRGGEPVGHGAGADRARRADGDPERAAASAWSTARGLLRRARRSTSRG